MYWRISPFVFSFAPRSQEWFGRAGQLGGFFPSKPANQHQMRAPVVRRHDGTPAVLANHSVYLKVSKTLLLIYNRRPQVVIVAAY